jgi:hypothetical protein
MTARNKIIKVLKSFDYTNIALDEVGYAMTDASPEVIGDIADAILNALGDMPFHVARFYRDNGGHGWTIQHRLDCRPDLLSCPFSTARPDRTPEPGDYHVELNPADYEEMRIIDG